jgi:chromosomal replication initiation ATPase DnaA
MVELAVALLRAQQRGIRGNFIEFLSQLNCLLIDDVHLCEAKGQLQVDLLEVINNHLKQSESVLVVSADVLPGKLRLSEPGLGAVMENGITEELGPPDEFERIQMLMAFAKDEDIPSPVVEYIAENCVQDIRELKAAIIHLLNTSRSMHKTIDLDLAKDVLSLNTKKIPQAIHEEEIRSDASQDMKISYGSRRGNNHHSQLLKEMIKSAENNAEHTLAQQIAISQMIAKLSQAKSPENRPIVAELQLALQSVRDGDLTTASELIQGKG